MLRVWGLSDFHLAKASSRFFGAGGRLIARGGAEDAPSGFHLSRRSVELFTAVFANTVKDGSLYWHRNLPFRCGPQRSQKAAGALLFMGQLYHPKATNTMLRRLDYSDDDIARIMSEKAAKTARDTPPQLVGVVPPPGTAMPPGAQGQPAPPA